MNLKRTALGLKIIVGGLLTLLTVFFLSFGALFLALIVVPCGLLVCFSGAQGKARWAIFAAMASLALSIGTLVLAGYQGGEGEELKLEENLKALSFVLLATSLSGGLAYADAICLEVRTLVLRPAFWLLQATVVAIVLLRLGLMLDFGSWPTLYAALMYSSFPFYLVLTGSLVLLTRDVSRSALAAARREAETVSSAV